LLCLPSFCIIIIQMPLSFTLGKETYALSDECMCRMALTMDRTVTRERGFPLMGRPLSNIQAGKEHIGGEIGLIPRVEGSIGYFHTHPDGEPSLSETDWEATIIHCSDLQIPYLLCSGAKGVVYHC